MPRVSFRGPTGEPIQDPSADYLCNLITAPPEGFWARGSGDAEIEVECSEDQKLSLLILHHEALGFYLKFLKAEGRRIVDTRSSLSDRARLTEVVTCSDEWMASAGLFLRPNAAADAVAEFASSGGLSEDVTWICPEEIPDGGNW